MTPSLISGWPKIASSAGDPDVSAQRELTAAAQRVAVHRGHHRLRNPATAVKARCRPTSEPHVGVGEAGHLLDVRPRREHLRSPPVSTTAAMSPRGALGRGFAEPSLDVGVQRVQLRPVDPDHADPVGDLEPHVRVEAAATGSVMAGHSTRSHRRVRGCEDRRRFV